jgi:anti-anti-sigma regulatory factor
MESAERAAAEPWTRVTSMDERQTADDAIAEPRGRVVLGASCTIHEAAAIKAHMLEQLSRPSPYEIDGSAVERVDAAGVQLLVAFALDCLERGLAYVWKGRSDALEQAIESLSVGALLDSPGTLSLAASD